MNPYKLDKYVWLLIKNNPIEIASLQFLIEWKALYDITDDILQSYSLTNRML